MSTGVRALMQGLTNARQARAALQSPWKRQEEASKGRLSLLMLECSGFILNKWHNVSLKNNCVNIFQLISHPLRLWPLPCTSPASGTSCSEYLPGSEHSTASLSPSCASALAPAGDRYCPHTPATCWRLQCSSHPEGHSSYTRPHADPQHQP